MKPATSLPVRLAAAAPILIILSAGVPSLRPGSEGGTPWSRGVRADTTCLTDLDSMRVIVARDYAGYGDKVPGHEAALGALTDSVRQAADTAADVWACTDALARWIRFFRDHHLSVSGPPRPRAANTSAGAPPLGPLGITFPDDSTAVLRLPSFIQTRRAIDSLVQAHRARLLATPYLVVDVRRNPGGGDASYDGVMRLIYTDSIYKYGFELWASEGNIASVMQRLSRPGVVLTAEESDALARLGTNRGRFVAAGGGGYVRYDTVHALPRSVGIIADRGCASSCEQFILDARQSRKVTTYGPANTGGLLDYGQVRTIILPSGSRRLGVPSSRSLRVAAGRLDNVGIAPDIHLPVGLEPVPLVAQHLRSNPTSGARAEPVSAPNPITWMDNPAIPAGGKNAVIRGTPTQPGAYVIQVKFPPDYRLMPHSHPKDRVYRVLSGTWFIGIGPEFDAAKLNAFPPGTVFLLPATTPHFHWARAGEFIVQVQGIGPTGIKYINPADDPRR